MSSSIAQRTIIKFLIAEGTKPSEIFRKLSVQTDNETSSTSLDVEK